MKLDLRITNLFNCINIWVLGTNKYEHDTKAIEL